MQKYQDVVQDAAGRAIAGASVSVYLTGTATLATLYADNGVTPKANPVSADSSGEYSFYAETGRYDLSITAPGFATETKTDVLVQDLDDVEVSTGTFAGLTDAPGDNALLAAALNERPTTATMTTALAGKLDVSSVVDSLSAGGTTVPASAETVKTLNTSISGFSASIAAKADKVQAETTVASATTTDLGAVASECVSITGTTTITGFGTVAAGTRREGRFTGSLLLTYNATSLILPGAASITTAANDRFRAVSLGSGNWLVYSYTRANGQPVVPTINSGQAQDTTAVTYNGSDGSVATYTMNGLTWTVAYNSDGTPNTETAGTLVKTYTYSGGKFTGVTGAVNAGERRRGAFSAKPAAADSSAGDSYWSTDTDFGGLMHFDGTRWVRPGAVARRIGTTVTPASNTLTNGTTTAAVTTFFTLVGGVIAFPIGSLYAGARYRLTVDFHRNGAGAAASLSGKFGTLNTTSDTTVVTIAMSGSDNVSERWMVDMKVGTDGKLQTTCNMGFSAASGTTDGFTPSAGLTVTTGSINYLNFGVFGQLNAADSVYITDILLEWMA